MDSSMFDADLLLSVGTRRPVASVWQRATRWF
jgi:hypothetical protein